MNEIWKPFLNNESIVDEWNCHILNSRKTIIYLNGFVYEGDYVDGYPQGKGQLTLDENTIVRGNFDLSNPEAMYTIEIKPLNQTFSIRGDYVNESLFDQSVSLSYHYFNQGLSVLTKDIVDCPETLKDILLYCNIFQGHLVMSANDSIPSCLKDYVNQAVVKRLTIADRPNDVGESIDHFFVREIEGYSRFFTKEPSRPKVIKNSILNQMKMVKSIKEVELCSISDSSCLHDLMDFQLEEIVLDTMYLVDYENLVTSLIGNQKNLLSFCIVNSSINSLILPDSSLQKCHSFCIKQSSVSRLVIKDHSLSQCIEFFLIGNPFE